MCLCAVYVVARQQPISQAADKSINPRVAVAARAFRATHPREEREYERACAGDTVVAPASRHFSLDEQRAFLVSAMCTYKGRPKFAPRTIDFGTRSGGRERSADLTMMEWGF